MGLNATGKFRQVATEMVEDLKAGCDDDQDAIKGFDAINELIKKADSIDAIECILMDEIGFSSEELIAIYRGALEL